MVPLHLITNHSSVIFKFDKFITPKKYDYNWVVSIELMPDTKKKFIFNVYLPHDKDDNEEEYLDCLTKLYNLLAECDYMCYCCQRL